MRTRVTDVNVIRVLENIDESDDVRMLANFKNLNFSLLELQFFETHVLLLDHFNGNFVLRFDVLCHFDLTELSFSEIILLELKYHFLPKCHKSPLFESNQQQF